MSFGTTIKINQNQIAKEFGKVTLVKLPHSSGYDGKAVMIASRYVKWGSIWINPNWDYKIKSGKNYDNDYAEWCADEVLEAFGANEGQNIDVEESYLKVTQPGKIEKEVNIYE